MKKNILGLGFSLGILIPSVSNAGFVINDRVTDAEVQGQILYITCQGEGICVNVYIDNGKAMISIPDLDFEAELVSYPANPVNPNGTLPNNDYQFTLKK